MSANPQPGKNARLVSVVDSVTGRQALAAPPGNGTVITVSDATVYTPPLRGIRNGGATAVTVVVTFADSGAAIALRNVQPGEVLVGFFAKVHSTGNTSTDLVGMW